MIRQKKKQLHKQCKRNVSSFPSLHWINSFVLQCKKPATIKIPKYESDRHGTREESTNYVFCGLLAKRPCHRHYLVQGYSFSPISGIQDQSILDYP